MIISLIMLCTIYALYHYSTRDNSVEGVVNRRRKKKGIPPLPTPEQREEKRIKTELLQDLFKYESERPAEYHSVHDFLKYREGGHNRCLVNNRLWDEYCSDSSLDIGLKSTQYELSLIMNLSFERYTRSDLETAVLDSRTKAEFLENYKGLARWSSHNYDEPTKWEENDRKDALKRQEYLEKKRSLDSTARRHGLKK